MQELFGERELGALPAVVSRDLTHIKLIPPLRCLNSPSSHPLRLNSLNVAWIVALLLYPLCLFLCCGAWSHHKVTVGDNVPDGHYICLKCRQLGIERTTTPLQPASRKGCYHCEPANHCYEPMLSIKLADMEESGKSPEVVEIAPAPPQQHGIEPMASGFAYFPSLPFFFPFSTITVELSPPNDHNGHANDCWEGFACKRDSCT